MQAILGAGGAIGKELARALRIYSKEIRLVSRTPQKVNDQDQLFPADLTIAEQVNAAVEGAEVVYLTAGLPYNLKIWQRDWPVIMENVINACILHDSRLVFFDNIYMYDGDHLNQIMETHTV
ncbi:MAG TPA: NAD(P)H-binding protein, partial [Arachidicoccus sp.]|nr:NAD(P)H-binding protein [Arachidicoccus sp.]